MSGERLRVLLRFDVRRRVEHYLTLGRSSCSHEIGIAGSVVSAWSYIDQYFGPPIDPTAPLRVRMVVHPDGVIDHDVMLDGAWLTVLSEDSPCELGAAFVGYWSEHTRVVPGGSVRAVDSISLCPISGGGA